MVRRINSWTLSCMRVVSVEAKSISVCQRMDTSWRQHPLIKRLFLCEPASTKPAYAFSTQQRYVSFMRDLRGADSLLQKAIEKVEDGKKLDMAQVTRHAATVRSGWTCCILTTGPHDAGSSFFFTFSSAITGSQAVHWGAEGVDEGGAGRHSIGQSAEGGRGRPGQDETRGPEISSVWRLQVLRGKELLCFKIYMTFFIQ